MGIDAKLTVEIEGGVAGSIVNNLETTVEGFALDARQGYQLDQKKLEKNLGSANAESVLYVSQDGGVIPLPLDAEIVDVDGKLTIKLKNGLSAYEIAQKNGFDGTEQEWVASLHGKDGSPGAPGKDGNDGVDGVGISSVKQTTKSTADDGDNIVTVTLTNGNTYTFTVQNGSRGRTGLPGSNGADGKPGEKGDPGEQGPAGADGYTPVKGTDYYTEADKAEMVSAVIAALPVYGGETA